jgi:hypothetical protein
VREHLVRFGVILRTNLQQRAMLRIHRRGPQRVRVHLTETLVAIDGDTLAARGDEELDETHRRCSALCQVPCGNELPRLAMARRVFIAICGRGFGLLRLLLPRRLAGRRDLPGT